MRRISAVSLVVLLVGSTVALTQTSVALTQTSEDGLPVSVLMSRKLASAQGLLKGIAYGDHAVIEREAQQLQLLSHDVSWNILQTRDYIRYSSDFRNAAEQIKNAAKQRQLDDAGRGYLKLTISCIDCHKHVRSAKK